MTSPRLRLATRLAVVVVLALAACFAAAAVLSIPAPDPAAHDAGVTPVRPADRATSPEPTVEEIALEIIPGFRAGSREVVTIRRDGTVTRLVGRKGGETHRAKANPQDFERLVGLLLSSHFFEMAGGFLCPDFDRVTVSAVRGGRRYSVVDGCDFYRAPPGLIGIVKALQGVVARIPEWVSLTRPPFKDASLGEHPTG